MAAVSLSLNNFKKFKNSLRNTFPEVKSSHIGEALAASMGYKTYTALLSDMRNLVGEPSIHSLSDSRFSKRLQELGYPNIKGFSFDELDNPLLIKTGNR
jgi:hypothetical protein